MKEINIDLYNDFGTKSEKYDNYLFKIVKLFKGTSHYKELDRCLDRISNEEDVIQDIIGKYLDEQKSSNE